MRNRVLVAVLLFLFSLQSIFPCSCIHDGELNQKMIKDKFFDADLVIIGKVKKIRKLSNTDDDHFDRYKVFTFEVIKRIKGEFKTMQIDVLSSYQTNCGTSFSRGKKYLIYGAKSRHTKKDKLTEEASTYITSVCWRNRKLNSVGEMEMNILKQLSEKY